MRRGSQRERSLISLCVIPTLMGIGHLPPAIGALWAARGTFENEMALLAMIASTAGIVDGKQSLGFRPPLSERRMG
jgi:hypothetical protein